MAMEFKTIETVGGYIFEASTDLSVVWIYKKGARLGAFLPEELIRTGIIRV
jgi:hypothetical protein